MYGGTTAAVVLDTSAINNHKFSFTGAYSTLGFPLNLVNLTTSVSEELTSEGLAVSV